MSQTMYAAIRVRSLILEVEKLHGTLARQGQSDRYDDEAAWVVVQEDCVEMYDRTVPLDQDRFGIMFSESAAHTSVRSVPLLSIHTMHFLRRTPCWQATDSLRCVRADRR